MEYTVGESIKFTVVVTVFQRENLVPRILHSLCSQTHKNWDAIFLSDGPHTAARNVVQKFAKMTGLPIRWKTSGRKPGLFGNHLRRQGLVEAEGDYVCIIGHDCMIDSEYLASHAESVANHPGTPLSIVQCRYWTLRSRDHKPLSIEQFRGLLPLGTKLPENFTEGDVDLTCMAFPREASLEHGAFDVSMQSNYSADWLSFVKCRNHIPVTFMPLVVCGHF